MASITVPSGGLPLSDFPTVDSGSKRSKVPQAIEIVTIGTETLDQLIEKMRNETAELMVSLGKKPVWEEHHYSHCKM